MTIPLRTFPASNIFNDLTPRNVQNVRNVRTDVHTRRSAADADKSHVVALSVRNACPHPRLGPRLGSWPPSNFPINLRWSFPGANHEAFLGCSGPAFWAFSRCLLITCASARKPYGLGATCLL